MRNPHGLKDLSPLTGRDRKVMDYVRADPKFDDMLLTAINACATGEAHVVFGCVGGKHRSVAMAELAADALRGMGKQVEVGHTAFNARAQQ